MSENERIPIGDNVTIYPRGKRGIWCADFWRDGRHCRQSLKTSNKKIAIQRAQKLEVELTSGTYQSPPPDTTIAEAIAVYLTHLATENRSAKTIERYSGIYEALREYLAFRNVTKLRQFTAAHFDQFRAHRKQTRQLRTMEFEGLLLKQLFKSCKSRKLLSENPIESVKIAKAPFVPKAGPSQDQIELLLGACKDQLNCMIAVLAFTGMRSGELQRLRKEDIDLAGNWIHIVSRPGAETKTRRSRKVPIHRRLRPILQAVRASPGPWYLCAPPSRQYPDGGHQINKNHLNDQFKRLLEKLQLPVGRRAGFSIHSLRHAFETIAINAGIPQRVVDAWLGHHADRSMGAVYYYLNDTDSQVFMKKVPFGTGAPAAGAGNKEEE